MPGDRVFERRGESLEERGEQGVLGGRGGLLLLGGGLQERDGTRGLLPRGGPVCLNPGFWPWDPPLLSLELNAKLNSVSVQMPGWTQTFPRDCWGGTLVMGRGGREQDGRARCGS